MKTTAIIKAVVAIWVLAAISMSAALFLLYETVSEQRNQIEKVDSLIADVYSLNVLTNDYIINQEDRAKRQWDKLYVEIDLKLNDLKFSNNSHEIESIERNLLLSKSVFDQLVISIDSNDVSTSVSAFNSRLIGQLSSASQSMIADSFSLAEFAQQEIDAANQTVLYLNIAFLIVVLLIAVIGGEVMLKGVAKPVAALAASEQRGRELNDVLKVINKILRHDVLKRLVSAREGLDVYKEDKDPEWITLAQEAMGRGVEVIKEMKKLEIFVSTNQKPEPTSVKKVINSLRSEFDIPIRVSGDVTVLADEALRSVFDNLIRNAVVHGKTKAVNVKAVQKNGVAEIRVIDQGKGIPNKIKEKVFEEGFTTGDSNNSGLGLFIVKKTIERYSGTIKIEDNQPRGTIFVLTLPTKFV